MNKKNIYDLKWKNYFLVVFLCFMFYVMLDYMSIGQFLWLKYHQNRIINFKTFSLQVPENFIYINKKKNFFDFYDKNFDKVVFTVFEKNSKTKINIEKMNSESSSFNNSLIKRWVGNFHIMEYQIDIENGSTGLGIYVENLNCCLIYYGRIDEKNLILNKILKSVKQNVKTGKE